MQTLHNTINDDIPLIKSVEAVGNHIGNTPLIRFNKLSNNPNVTIFAKQEWKQLGGSVKARPAYNIIRRAIETGELSRNKILLDATSGNTGIAYAAICRELGIKVALCLPENASEERKNMLCSLGAEIIFTSKFEGTDGAQQEAASLARLHPLKYFYANQYTNENNWKAHYFYSAPEIIKEVPDITHFVAGLGTTGTFTGTGKRLKSINPQIRLVSLQPDLPMHGLEGWKHLETALVPLIYDDSIADEMLEVATEEAYEMIVRIAKQEGLLLSPSSAANLVGALKVAEKLDNGVIVTVLPDNADKYPEIIKQLLG